MKWVNAFCKHRHVRCVHGDEIIARGFRRVACLDCDGSLEGPLPQFCYVTGEYHPYAVPTPPDESEAR
ncbi:hypothetical protein HNR05_000969 [Leifsonia psychrotolerans]|uniref:Uncharacterized protein n=1 Tax=Glaciibacter psychrotolerans TaxID=670054 RepID=A0A7Z0J5T4_9MICO|nr:hypothetical protein [Leifsonia psychrotolerans]